MIDPGDNIPEILDILKRHGLTVKAIVITHAHIDHIGGAHKLRAATGAPVYMNQNDTLLRDMLDVQAQWLGVETPEKVTIDTPVREGDKLLLGTTEFAVLDTPGHTQGSICLWIPAENKLIAGDTLFRDSIGRTDLPGGDGRQILRSIHDKLLPLPDDAVVIPGHGETPPSGARSSSTIFCRGFRASSSLRHYAGDQLLGVGDGFADQLHVHGGLAGLARALAVDAVLAHQHQRVGQHVERDRELAARLAHHEFVLFEFVAALVVNAHDSHCVTSDPVLLQKRPDVLLVNLVFFGFRKSVLALRHAHQFGVVARVAQGFDELHAVFVGNRRIGVAVNGEDRRQAFAHIGHG